MIKVQCQCGKSLAVQPSLAGKRVRCPSCKSPISVSAPQDSSGSIGVACQCGQQFSAKPHLAGKQVRCPMCRQAISVPDAAAARSAAYAAASQSLPADDEFWDELSAPAPATPEPAELAPDPLDQAAPRARRPARPKFTGPMPDSTRTACAALATGGFLWTIFAGIGFYLMSTEKIDAVGQGVTMFFACLALGGFVSAALIRQRVRLAVIPAVLVSAFYLRFFPLGTVIAAIVLLKLFADDSRRYLDM